MNRFLSLVVIATLAGCATTRPSGVTNTEVIEKRVPVHCKAEIPAECQGTYAVDALQLGADPVQVNRAIRAEIEQRAACEVKLRAALKGCNDGSSR